MEGVEETHMVEPNIIETYGNADTEEASQLVVGFTEDKTAFIKRLILDSDDEWTDWESWGSSVDYTDNQAFATLNGCPFKINNAEV